MVEKFSIKWKSFVGHFVGEFSNLCKDGHFTDVTLISDDKIQVLAHRLVLSASSQVLRKQLINHTDQHPMLYLEGIEQAELHAILKFMYFGETQILESRVNEFLKAANILQVKEISTQDPQNSNEKTIDNENPENKTVNKEKENAVNF